MSDYQISLDRTANVPISAGIHEFIVSDAVEGESSSSNPMWTLTLACQTPGEEGKTARLFLVLTPSARWKLENFLDAVRAPKTGSATVEKFINRRLRAEISHREYEGRTQADVGAMFPTAIVSGGSAPAPAAPKAPAVKATVKAAPAKSGKAQKAGSLPKDVAGEDETSGF